MHRPRRMRFGHVERGEIMPLILDLRPFGNGEAHVGEDFGQFVHHLADRMYRTAREFGCRQRHIQPLGRQPFVERCRFQRRLLGRQRRRHCFAQAVDDRPLHLPLIGRHRTHRLEQRGDAALLAQRRYAHRFERIGGVGGIDGVQQVRLQISILHLRHSREGGNHHPPLKFFLRRWVPAFAGMMNQGWIVRLHKQKGANGKCRPRPFAHSTKVEA